MVENQILLNKNSLNEKTSYSENLIINLLENYSYDEILNYLFDEENKIVNESLKNKLKELVEKIDIEELARLLTKEEINKLLSTQKSRINEIQNVGNNDSIIIQNNFLII